MAGVYIVAQLLGAMRRVRTKTVMPEQLFDATRRGPVVSSAITTGQAIAIEAIATFFLVFAVFARPSTAGAKGGRLRDRPDHYRRHPRGRAAHRRLHESRPLLRPRRRQRDLRGAF